MNFKLIAGLTIICLIAIFIIQNIAIVEVRVIFWSIAMSMVLLILILLGIGIVTGWLLNDYFRHRKRLRIK
jgi:uncharacterized integral membrane protein